DRGVILKAHRRLELAAVPADARGDGALNLVVGPGADAFGLARRDVARGRDAPGPGEVETAGAQTRVPLTHALLHRRMAFHAMRDGRKVKAFLHFVAHHRFGVRL